MKANSIYKTEVERSQALKGFYLHLIGYIVINAGLLSVNVITSPGRWWFCWPLTAWGFGLAVHGISVHFGRRFWPESWETRWPGR
jgi:hypothetical protein